MKNPLIRWYVFFITIMLSLIFILVGGGAKFLLDNDSTYISWILMSIFLVGSINLGFLANKSKSQPFHELADYNYDLVKWITNIMPSIGMIGTVIGIMTAMDLSFATINPGDPESMSMALSSLMSGTFIALTTTLVGLVGYVLLSFQIAMLKLKSLV